MTTSRKQRSAACLVAFALLVSGCAGGGAPVRSSASQATEYRLGGGDGLRLIFYGEDKLNGEYRIGGDGMLALPLIGQVKAEGLTIPELQTAIAAAYSRGGYLLDPKVAVEVLEYRPFFILGEVNAPGQYPFIPGMSVRQAIATAKGYTYRARQGTAMITHWQETNEVPYAVQPGTKVTPGDTIRVPERHF